MTSGRTIDYEALAQEAMRGVVRQVLTRVAKSGLPGDHHFYISFDTQQPGVVLSKRLKEKYPEEMTIVLQHRFWDLTVNEDRFDVKLTFDGIPERLVVPFASIKVFFDPSVRYGLQFEDAESTQDGAMGADASHSRPFGASGDDDRPSGRTMTSRSKRPLRKPRLERVDTSAPTDARSGDEEPAGEKTEDAPSAPEARPAAARTPDLKPVPAPAPAPAAGAQIVSLSDFRKK